MNIAPRLAATAAPDLYAALRDMLSMIEKGEQPRERYGLKDQRIVKARVALAKAEGRL